MERKINCWYKWLESKKQEGFSVYFYITNFNNGNDYNKIDTSKRIDISGGKHHLVVRYHTIGTHCGLEEVSQEHINEILGIKNELEYDIY